MVERGNAIARGAAALNLVDGDRSASQVKAVERTVRGSHGSGSERSRKHDDDGEHAMHRGTSRTSYVCTAASVT
jgi:hypothetical protein